MTKIQIFDPPMCCPTGVCGPSIDPVLPAFAADLDWLKAQGLAVERYNLAQEPAAFAGNELVKKALTDRGNASLPLVLVDGHIVASGFYPPREALAKLAGVTVAAQQPAQQEEPQKQEQRQQQQQEQQQQSAEAKASACKPSSNAAPGKCC